MLRGILGLLLITSLLVTAVHVHAQGYPSGAVNLVIPLAPGDASDVAGRLTSVRAVPLRLGEHRAAAGNCLPPGAG